MVYPIFKIMIAPILNFFIKEVRGSDNLPKKGIFIIASNQQSNLDGLILNLVVVHKLNKWIYMLSRKFWNMASGGNVIWMKWLGLIPVEGFDRGKMALKIALRFLKKEKRIVGIFPEGRRSKNGRLLRGKTGVARLALKAKVPVVPIGLINTNKVLAVGKMIPRFRKKIKIKIGKPLFFNEFYGKYNDYKTLRTITTKVMKEIGRLTNRKYLF